MNNCLRIAASLLILTLAACGTTGNIQPSVKSQATVPPVRKGTPVLDLSGYDKVVVLDFVDATDKGKLKASELRSYTDTMSSAVHSFPELIAQDLRDTGVFKEVVRGPSSGKALVISGRITRLTEGNATLRLLIGMGAGSSYFDAATDLSDAESGDSLGHVSTDKNSWVLGGGLAATQTVQSFMQGAAQKIAAQVRDGKDGTQIAGSH